MNLFNKVVNENDSEEDDGAYGGLASDVETYDVDDFTASTTQERSVTQKRKWITPRLCAALDKAKVKRMRLKK